MMLRDIVNFPTVGVGVKIEIFINDEWVGSGSVCDADFNDLLVKYADYKVRDHHESFRYLRIYLYDEIVTIPLEERYLSMKEACDGLKKAASMGVSMKEATNNAISHMKAISDDLKIGFDMTGEDETVLTVIKKKKGKNEVVNVIYGKEAEDLYNALVKNGAKNNKSFPQYRYNQLADELRGKI